MISECFYYQLHAQPVHSALSFYYSIRELATAGASEPLKKARVVVCPSAARVMMAPFELTDLHVNHGSSGSPW